MTHHRRRILRWLAAILAIVLLAGGLVFRVATSKNVIDSVPLTSGEYNVRFLTADVGKLNFSTDDTLRAFLRQRLPTFLVRKLGDVTTVRGYNTSRPEFGDPPLVTLFQLLSPQNTIQNNTSIVFGKIEFPESTGFVFAEEINGYNSHGQGTSIHHFYAFPRRDPLLTFRLYDRDNKRLMEKTLPNPGYRSDFPQWTPQTLPAVVSNDGLQVTLNSLNIDSRQRRVIPVFDVEGSDTSWQKPVSIHTWTDATGNSGEWLSPFEPAWKLHLRLRRRHDAEFPALSTWKVGGLALPSGGLTLSTVEQSQVVDGIGLKVRYVAPASKLREENGTITLSPPQSPGQTGMSTSAGSTTANGQLVRYSEIEVGMPYIRVDHDTLPAGVELVCHIRDENGVLLNGNALRPGMGGVNGVSFYAVYYAARPETKTLNLEVRVSRPKDFEFVIEPPAELRKAISNDAANSKPEGK